MPLHKGQASESYKQGKLQRRDFSTRSKEEMREIARKGGLKKGENAAKRRKMREQLDVLMRMDVKKKEYKELMERFGIESEDQINQTLLMVRLFQKGLMGDVAAIRQIDEMTNGLTNNNSAQPIVININSVSSNRTEEGEDDEWADYEDDEDWE